MGAVTERSTERSPPIPPTPRTNGDVTTNGIIKPICDHINIPETLNLSNEEFNTYKVCK